MSFFSMVAPSGKILDLRNLLAERFPHPPLPVRSHLRTGLPLFDEITGGGLPKSALTELISPYWSGGSASVIAALVETAHRNCYFVALIDGQDSFDPSSLAQSSLAHLLWARCQKISQTIKAADLLLRDGNFPLLIIDLVLNPPQETRKIPQTSWYRLQRLAEESPTACLVLTRKGMVESAQLKLVLEHSWTMASLENENLVSQLRVRLERSHLAGQNRAWG